MGRGVTIFLHADIKVSSNKIIFRKYFERIIEIIEENYESSGERPLYINLKLPEDHFLGSFMDIPLYTNKKEESKMSRISSGVDSKAVSKYGVRAVSIKKVEKHILLNEALEVLERLPITLDDFLDKIGQEERPVEDSSTKLDKNIQDSSLSGTLEQSPQRIYNVISKIEGILSNIDEKLF